MTDDTAALTAEIRTRVAALGFELVDLRRRGTARRVVLQVRVDRADAEPGHGISVDECATVSRALEAWIDEEGLLGPKYVLEVSSPGIERPIRWREHWERFTGRDVHVRVAGRPRLRATIVGLVEGSDAVILRPVDGSEEITIEIGEMRDATLAVDWSRIEGSRDGRKGN